jgi:hypothetical protein
MPVNERIFFISGTSMKTTIAAALLFCCILVYPQDTIQPVPTYKPAPAYPENAKKLRVEGQIFLSVLVSKTGAVIETELVQAMIRYPEGKAMLESKRDLMKIAPSHRNSAAKLVETAQQTAKQWKFTPARVNGTSEEAMIVIPFTFKLNTNPPPPGIPLNKLKK